MRKFLLLLALVAAPVWAVEPDELLDDPVLEARARSISLELRCPVCQNESIDDSHASVAKDLRIYVRERLVAGDSDREVIDAVVSRYGEFVLLRPNHSGANILLWIAGPLALLLGGFFAFRAIRGASVAAPTAAGLSEAEQAELERLLKE